MRQVTRLASAIFFLSVGASAATAQDLKKGEEIAHMWCAGCHVVDRQTPQTRNDAVPSFVAIAGQTSTTSISLAAFLTTSHPRMPNYTLSRQEIRDVSGYILSLKD